MVTLYGIAREDLAPDRPTAAVRDAGTGTITIGSVTFPVDRADDETLRSFLSAVRTQRGVAAGAGLALRAGDAALLAEVLGGTPADIVANLQRLLGLGESEAVELGRWMFRRTALAGALALGLAAGVVGTGTLAANAPAAGAEQVSTAGRVAHVHDDANWAEIGDAAVLQRGDAAPPLPGTDQQPR
jgi:hypothetical protein